MKKRGQLVYKALISVIVSAIVVAAFVIAGKTYGNQEAYHKLAVAKDLALVLDAIYSYSGDIEFRYPNEISDYIIEVKDNVVKVYSKKFGKADPTSASYGFAGISAESLNFEIKDAKYVRIEKISGKIVIKKGQVNEI